LAREVKPLIVLITVDALRFDVVDDPRVEGLDNLRAIAARGASFSRARSTSASTSPTLATMFTGRHFSSLYWTELPDSGKLKFFLPEEATIRFPEILTRAGVRTRAVTTAPGFVASYGIVRGFEEETRRAKGSAAAIPLMIELLASTPADRAGFAYAHLLDAHAPYGKGKKGDPPRERYLDSLRFIDTQIGKLLGVAKRPELEGRTYIIVSADHGEAFGEHGTTHHASTVYEELIHVPLLVQGPGVKHRVVDEPVSTIDFGPTVLDLMGQDTPGSFLGQSLVPLLRGDDVQLTRPIIVDSGRRLQSLIDRSGMKVIRDVRGGTVEMYDLSKDPGELVNLAERQPEPLAARVQALSAFFGLHELRRDGYVIPYRN
jgi:arylsulfatase A-like enzyme